MGSAWCRSRAEEAKNSKSPVDRMITRCVNQFCPMDAHSQTPCRLSDSTLNSLPRERPEISPPALVHSTGKIPLGKALKTQEWTRPSLEVPVKQLPTAPVPPPRKKRKNFPMESDSNIQSSPRTSSLVSSKDFFSPRCSVARSSSLPDMNEVFFRLRRYPASVESFESVGLLKKFGGSKDLEKWSSTNSFPSSSFETVENLTRRRKSSGFFLPVKPIRKADISFDLSDNSSLCNLLPVSGSGSRGSLQTKPEAKRKINFSVNGAVAPVRLSPLVSERQVSLLITPRYYNNKDSSSLPNYVTSFTLADIPRTELSSSSASLNGKRESKGHKRSLSLEEESIIDADKVNIVEEEPRIFIYSETTKHATEITVQLENVDGHKKCQNVNESKSQEKDNETINSIFKQKNHLILDARTPPPSPEVWENISNSSLETENKHRNSTVGHSSLLKILQEYQDHQQHIEKSAEEQVDETPKFKDIVSTQKNGEQIVVGIGSDKEASENSSTTPSLKELEAVLAEFLESNINSEDEKENVNSQNTLTTAKKTATSCH